MHVLIRGAGVAGLTLARELVRQGVKVTVLDRRAGIAGNASWFAGGMLAPWCERESAEEAVLTEGRLAVDWWDEALPGHVERKGTLVVAPARDSRELNRFAARTSGYEWCGADGIAVLEPDLSGRFARGLHFPGEAHLDPRKAMVALADGRLRGVRGEMLILLAPEVTLSRPVRLLHPRIPVYIVPRADHHFMVGATMIESTDAGPISARSTMELLNAAYALHPAFAEAKIVETGVGIRPAYPDNLPKVERSGHMIRINGLYRHGFLLAPAMARRAATMILDEEPGDKR